MESVKKSMDKVKKGMNKVESARKKFGGPADRLFDFTQDGIENGFDWSKLSGRKH